MRTSWRDENNTASGLLVDAAPCRSHVRWLVWVILALSGSLVTSMRGAEPGAAQRTGEFEIRVVDAESKQPIAVNLFLRDARGRPVKAPRQPFWKDHFSFLGSVVLKLRPGQYTFEMERGPEYKLRSGNFLINPGATDNTEVSTGAVCGNEERRLVVRRPAHSPATGGHSPVDARAGSARGTGDHLVERDQCLEGQTVARTSAREI